MHIERFAIENYRSCKNSVVEFNPNLTVLIGKNASGKTNLLNAIQLFYRACSADRLYRNIRPTSHEEVKMTLQLASEQKKVGISGKLILNTDEINMDEVVQANLKWNFSQPRKKSEWLNIPQEVLSPQRFGKHFFLKENKTMTFADLEQEDWLISKEWNEILPPQVYQSINEVIGFFKNLKYYSASQFSDPTKCPLSIEIEKNRPPWYRASRNVHQQFLLDLFLAYNSNSKAYQRFINTVGRAGIRLVDEITFAKVDLPESAYEVRSGGKLIEKKRNKAIAIPQIKIGSSTLSPHQLSEGTFKTLALVFYIFTDSSKILLIEEPEVCIHHGLLNSLLSIIKDESQRKQVIMSTHSDYVLDCIAPENVIVVTKHDDKGTKAFKMLSHLRKNEKAALHEYLNNVGNLGEYLREGGYDEY